MTVMHLVATRCQSVKAWATPDATAAKQKRKEEAAATWPAASSTRGISGNGSGDSSSSRGQPGPTRQGYTKTQTTCSKHGEVHKNRTEHTGHTKHTHTHMWEGKGRGSWGRQG